MQYGKYRTRIRALVALGSQSYQNPRHQRHQLRSSDVGPNRPASLAPTQEMTEFAAQFLAGRRDDRPQIDSGFRQSLYKIAPCGDFGHHMVHKVEESDARVRCLAQGPSVVNQLLQSVMDDGLDKRLLRRKVAVQRPWTNAGPASDFIEGDGDTLGGEGGCRGFDEPFIVSASVGSPRFLSQERSPIDR